MSKRTSRKPLAENPPILVTVDRDLTASTGGLVGRFEEDVTVYRVMDGEELCIAVASGAIEGGMFATRLEREYGASWAATSLGDVAGWGKGWAGRRLGKDLFVAEASASGRVFYRELTNADRETLGIDPSGLPKQEVRLDTAMCNTGLGCSFVVRVTDARFYRVIESGEAVPMTAADVAEYVRKHPLPEIAVRPMGLGGTWEAGVVLGKSVSVGKDENDDLWRVENRKDRPIVLGAKSKKQALEEARRVIGRGGYEDGLARLNKIPAGFEKAAPGQTWVRTTGGWGPEAFEIDEVGASYARGYWVENGERLFGSHVVSAKDLLAKWAYYGKTKRK